MKPLAILSIILLFILIIVLVTRSKKSENIDDLSDYNNRVFYTYNGTITVDRLALTGSGGGSTTKTLGIINEDFIFSGYKLGGDAINSEGLQLGVFEIEIRRGNERITSFTIPSSLRFLNTDIVLGRPYLQLRQGDVVSIIVETVDGSLLSITNPTFTFNLDINCQVGNFSEFSPCSRECGGGTRTRSRTVVPPVGTGAACPHLTETVECNTQACPVNCQVSEYGEFSRCSRECGGGTRTRSRTVVVPPAGTGAACPNLTETEDCNTQVCSVNCQVSEYGEFSRCTRECGGGTRTRSRTVVVPPAGTGAACPNLTETEDCNTQVCPVNCQVSEYGEFSPCTRPCGGGTMTKTRTVEVHPTGTGAACPNLTVTVDCNTQACPSAVNCQVSEYGEFSPCTRECGGGTRTRTRTVVVSPVGTGAACPRLTETEDCNTQRCPFSFSGDITNDRRVSSTGSGLSGGVDQSVGVVNNDFVASSVNFSSILYSANILFVPPGIQVVAPFLKLFIIRNGQTTYFNQSFSLGFTAGVLNQTYPFTSPLQFIQGDTIGIQLTVLNGTTATLSRPIITLL